VDISTVKIAIYLENIFEKRDHRGYAGFAGGDYRFKNNSLAGNAGLNYKWDQVSANAALDLAGQTRVYDGNIDLGCYEIQADVTPAFRY